MLSVAVLASGEGTTLEALAERAAHGALSIRFVLVVSDRPGAPVLARADRLGLPSVMLSPKGVVRDAWASQLTAALEARGVELVVLAGFLPILPPSWVARWQGRAVNLHPSLLPRYGGPGFHGLHVHEAVLAAGDRETGASVHLVSAEVDRGTVLAQRRLAVRPGESVASLRERLHPVEIELLAETLARFADGSLPLPYPDGAAGPAPERRAPP